MTQTIQYAELRTYTPGLGEFVITGSLDDVEAAGRSFGRVRRVSESSFDKAVYGRSTRRRLAFF